MVSEVILLLLEILQPTFTCTKSTLEMPVQCVKYVQRYNTDTRKMYVLMYLLITLNRLYSVLVFSIADLKQVNANWDEMVNFLK